MDELEAEQRDWNLLLRRRQEVEQNWPAKSLLIRSKDFARAFFSAAAQRKRKTSTEVLESIQKQQKEASYGTNLILTKVRVLLNFLPSQDLKRKVGNLIRRSRTHRNFGRASTATKTKNWSQRKKSKLRTTTVKVCQTTWKETFPDVQIHLWPKLFLIGVLEISRDKL